MDKIIEEYHGHKKEDKHVSHGATKLECPPLPEDEAAMHDRVHPNPCRSQAVNPKARASASCLARTTDGCNKSQLGLGVLLVIASLIPSYCSN